jgi:hypothetical protein
MAETGAAESLTTNQPALAQTTIADRPVATRDSPEWRMAGHPARRCSIGNSLSGAQFGRWPETALWEPSLLRSDHANQKLSSPKSPPRKSKFSPHRRPAGIYPLHPQSPARASRSHRLPATKQPPPSTLDPSPRSSALPNHSSSPSKIHLPPPKQLSQRTPKDKNNTIYVI